MNKERKEIYRSHRS